MNGWFKPILILLVLLMIGAAIANVPLWVPFLVVGIIVVLLLFFGSKR